MPEKVLIVEDEPVLQETLVYNLTRQGYHVETAGTIPCSTCSRKSQPDLIVLDVIPGLDGFEVCRILRKR
jgi:two-component system alkaline phosphatase synthesis response regulator PhoP